MARRTPRPALVQSAGRQWSSAAWQWLSSAGGNGKSQPSSAVRVGRDLISHELLFCRPHGTLGRAAAVRRHRQPRDHRVAAFALLPADTCSHDRSRQAPASTACKAAASRRLRSVGEILGLRTRRRRSRRLRVRPLFSGVPARRVREFGALFLGELARCGGVQGLPSCGRDIAGAVQMPDLPAGASARQWGGVGSAPPAWAAPLRALRHGEAEGCVRCGLCRPLSVKNCLGFSRRCSCPRERRRVVMDGRWR